ncbi:hypothetical protein GCM10023225_09000 [Kineococcus glutinatus]|uniref:DNA helicase n=2 Tax=Kineococcus glutinatus TaxID=1070872 RepID=A0ABP9HEA7_9ACTN
MVSLRRPDVKEAIRRRLAQSVKALIVDEVYDANALDLAVIKAAVDAGADVTIIGDPWQALYGFRGARPDLVPALIEETEMVTLPLSQSFRWRSGAQSRIATDLRAGRGVVLPQVENGVGFDVMLSSQWEELWTLGDTVLPLAWGGAKGNAVEAATTLLLNQVTKKLFGVEATFLADALVTLGIADAAAMGRLEGPFAGILGRLSAATTKVDFNSAYYDLISVMEGETKRTFPAKAHHNYTIRLRRLALRLKAEGACLPGLTIHQAKGREWDNVGVRLADAERAALERGLDPADERHRLLYVACTRARNWTAEALPRQA